MKSYKEILEALKGNQHKIDKNKNGKIDAQDFKLLRKEESELSEATVKTQKYSWGTMKTIHHGADFSIPLHPEHHEAIAKLKDEQEHKFKTEDGKHWTARRKGEDVHFHSGNDGPKTMVKHSALKEEVEDEEERVARADYKVSSSGRKSHKEIVFKHGESDKKDLEEKLDLNKASMGDVIKDFQASDAPQFAGKSKEKRREMAIAAKLEAERSVKEEVEEIEELNKSTLASYAKKATHDSRINQKIAKDFEAQSNKSRKPDMKRASDVLRQHYQAKAFKREDGVNKAIDRLTKEEVETIEERNKQNATMRKMMDASRGARFKAAGNSVPDAEPEHKTAQAHNKAIGRALRNEEKKEDVPFEGPYTKVKGDVKDKSGAVHTPMSKAKHLARMAMKKQMKEDIDRLFEAKEKTEYDFEGDMARGQLQSIASNAQKVHDMLKDNDNLPEWVQSKITLAEDYISTVANYMMSELDEQAPVAPVPGQKWKDHAVMVNGKKRVVINRSNAKNYPEHEGWKEVSPGQKIKEDDEVKFSYTELMMMVEGRAQYLVKATHKDTGRVKVTTYVADKDESEYGVRSRAEREHKPSGYQIDSVRRKDVEADDSDDESSTSSTQKRGRGRPAGAKSGARGPRIK